MLVRPTGYISNCSVEGMTLAIGPRLWGRSLKSKTEGGWSRTRSSTAGDRDQGAVGLADGTRIPEVAWTPGSGLVAGDAPTTLISWHSRQVASERRAWSIGRAPTSADTWQARHDR